MNLWNQLKKINLFPSKKNLVQTCIVFFIIIFLSSCKANDKTQVPPGIPTEIPVNSTIEANNTIQRLSTCDLIDEAEIQAIFSETPLIYKQENGSCRISNQWETRAIVIRISQDDQAYQAIRWDTKKLISGWNNPDLIDQVNKVLVDGQNTDLAEFQKTTIPIYELIGFRSERVLTVGDTAFWLMYPEAFTGILDIIDKDRYLQFEFFGFLPGIILNDALNIAKITINDLPDQFVIDFSFDELNILPELSVTTTPQDGSPKITQLNVDRKKIYFGDLCNDETTNIDVIVSPTEQTYNVYLVYRLVSTNETNKNWITLKMENPKVNEWHIMLNAEKDFNSFLVVNNAQVEYSIAIIYGVDGVFRSPIFRDIIIYQCLG